MRNRNSFITFGWTIILIAALVNAIGCVQVANLIHVVKGNTRPAEYKGLRDKQVAIICGSENGINRDEAASMLCLFVQTTLEREIKDVKFVSREAINKCLDAQQNTTADFYGIGSQLKADQVLAIDMRNMSLKDGSTLYRGSADIFVTVYDIAEGNVAYRKSIPEFTFPKVGGASVHDTSESKFRGAYISVAAQKIASLFYAADATSEYGLDATISGF